MISEREFVPAVVEMIRRAETRLPKDVVGALEKKVKTETHGPAKLQLELMLKNLEVAEKRGRPICQDTGTFTFFVRIGRNLRLRFDLQGSLERAVSEATEKVPLRPNVVDPMTRKPTKSNVGPGQPVVHMELVEGEGLQIDLLVRGSGAENCGRLFMLGPMEGREGIGRAVLTAVAEAGGKPCPPTVVGVGIGGTCETACIAAERALLRPLDRPNPDPVLNGLEREIEKSANRLNVGCMGLGGKTTVLGVHAEKVACHTASLPVAVVFQCWAARRAKAMLAAGRLRTVEP